ncbi:PRC-barrel domain-containing protein [Gymnodinialimonas sp. 2305UL16-5]|uniref:PRC-barrel domain-containing protein n=1 Tax=Gymnodinialimonas mytili TaxID=3126503 RepID=UPI00309FFB47
MTREHLYRSWPTGMRLLASAATALALATPVYAQDHNGAFMDMTFDAAENLNASEIIGMRVYASEADIANEALPPEGERDWNDIGEIHEIVLTRSGEVASVIVDVGGFLGIGEREVAIDMSQLQILSEEDSDDFFLVLEASLAGVEEAPEYNARIDDMEAETELDADADGRAMLTAPDVTRDGYEPAEVEQLTSEMLTGARVYGSGDEDVGEVGSLLLSDDGTIDQLIIDVGGFLGIGEHEVAVTLDELTILQSEGDVRVYIDATQETLEQQPAYDG